MKTFPIRGGIHPDYRKEETSEKAIVALPMPARLYIPLQQHIGAAAEALVTEGEAVKKGQAIARHQGAVSATQHAPTSGRIVAITEFTAPHPSGLAQATIIIEPDGNDEWGALPAPIFDPLTVDAEEIRQRVAASGIVGMGGAAFPSAVKLDLGKRYKLEILLINGAECEPYLTCDDRVMREHAAEVIDGTRIMAHALGVPRIIVAIEENKPQALAIMTKAASGSSNVEVIGVPVQYPMGSERHLTQAITGRETPARGLTADIGVVVHNVSTARAVHHAVRFGRPLVSRIVTVSGHAVREPKNIEVLIGTRVADLVEFCGGLAEEPVRLVNGGPMMGQPLPSLDVPVVKGMSGILALAASEVNEGPENPCIRCGSCVSICPCGLVPAEMASFIRKDMLENAANLGVRDCVSCGSCSWICPSRLPLVHYFNYAKGVLNAQERDRNRLERVKKMVEAHNQRLEKATAAAAAKRAAKTPPASQPPANKGARAEATNDGANA